MKITAALRRRALRHPGAEEGIACEGTALEKRTIKARGKAFLFLGAADAMLKLDGSLEAARRLAAKQPDRYRVGAHGWVSIRLDDEAPVDLLGAWIDESHGLAAPPPKEPKAAARRPRG